MDALNGRVGLVTGAGGGIGREIARRLARVGRSPGRGLSCLGRGRLYYRRVDQPLRRPADGLSGSNTR